MALAIKFSDSPFKYLQSLDKPTRERIKKKLEEIAAAPFDPRLSKPLTESVKRSARVGSYRILFEIVGPTLWVVRIAPRGQVYR